MRIEKFECNNLLKFLMIKTPMGRIKLLFFLVLLTVSLKSQTVSVTEALKHEGEMVTVCAKVAGTYVTKGESKVIYLNLEKPYPNNPLTIVIFEKNAENFDYNPLEFLKNKNICVSGKITFYKDKPQIIATKQEQIKIQK